MNWSTNFQLVARLRKLESLRYIYQTHVIRYVVRYIAGYLLAYMQPVLIASVVLYRYMQPVLIGVWYGGYRIGSVIPRLSV